MRRENVEMRVYALMTAARGPKLEKSRIAEQDCTESPIFGGTACHHGFIGGAGRGVHGDAVDMDDLALCVSNWADAPVIDQTGYKGLFSIQTEGWATPLNDDPSRPGLAKVLARFDLKLVEKKAPVEVFAVEHIERPSENAEIALPKRKNPAQQLTPLELEIMNVLWETGPANVQTVQARIEGRELAYTTVQTMFNILHRKGKVKRQLKERAYVYRPVLSRQKAVTQAVGEMLDRFFGGRPIAWC